MTEQVYGSQTERSYDGRMMEKGKEAEEIVKTWIESKPNIKRVVDCRNDRKQQTADIDFMVEYRDGKLEQVEIKSDDYLTANGNVLFEFARINHTAPHDSAVALGWSAKTPARYIIYYATKERRVYKFDTEKLRKAVQKYTRMTRPQYGAWVNEAEAFKIQMRWISTDNLKSTLVLCVPLKDVPTDAYTTEDVSQFVAN